MVSDLYFFEFPNLFFIGIMIFSLGFPVLIWFGVGDASFSLAVSFGVISDRKLLVWMLSLAVLFSAVSFLVVYFYFSLRSWAKSK